MFAAFVAQQLIAVGYITVVKGVINFADKKVNEKKESK